MAEPGDLFKQSDVTAWGIAVLVLGAVALLTANLSALLPPNVMAGLHSTRLDGGNLNHLRAQVADLRDKSDRMRNENNRLTTMLTLTEENQGEVTRRVGAIESTLPGLIDTRSSMVNVDRSLVTSAIGEKEPASKSVRQVDGGSVVVTRTPLDKDGNPLPETPETDGAALQQPMPPVKARPSAPELSASTDPVSAYGIALGPQVTIRDAFVAWQDITNKVGPLLIGLGPLLSGNAGAGQQRLVAGPIDDYAEAEQLCVHMLRVGISCLPVPYAGRALPR